MAVPRNATDRVEARCEGLALFPEKSLTTHRSGSIFIPLCKTGFHAWHALGRRNGDSAGFSLDWLDFSANAWYLITPSYWFGVTPLLVASKPCRRLPLLSASRLADGLVSPFHRLFSFRGGNLTFLDSGVNY